MDTEQVKYSDVLVDQLVELGYTHCFFLGGGNIMHLVESARTRMTCIAVTHEVSAGIAAEYFNVAMRSQQSRAVVFVTAGPGFTNLVSAIAGAWLESRELLIIGGQARTEFLSNSTVRQIGHQEIDGVSIASPITKAAVRVEAPLAFNELQQLSELSATGRKGPVFIELCLDVSASFVEPEVPSSISSTSKAASQESSPLSLKLKKQIREVWLRSERPLLLVGQGLEYKTFDHNFGKIQELALPVATSWNAADYLDYDDPLYAGRPNQYGMRWANAVIQQCDLLIVVGARLGLQQTGFNWEKFAPFAQKVHLEIDPFELEKLNPGVDLKVLGDANQTFPELLQVLLDSHSEKKLDWLGFIEDVRNELPVAEAANQIYEGFVNPFQFIDELATFLDEQEISVIPCSSGGTYTTVMQSFRQKRGQLLTNDKALASMGYGLAGAIGTAVALPNKKIVHLEGDGGFLQNANEVGTVRNQNLNLKMIIMDNGGYASIRLSQRAYFDGNYIGCDEESGIGLPRWTDFFDSFSIPSTELTGSLFENHEALQILSSDGPGAIVLKVNKDQPFYPKLTSRIFADGTMKSNPLHILNPPLPDEVAGKVFRYLPEEMRSET